MPSIAQLTAGLRLYLHFLPYLILIAILGRLVLSGLFGAELETGLVVPGDSSLLIHARTIARGIAVGIVFGIAGGLPSGQLYPSVCYGPTIISSTRCSYGPAPGDAGTRPHPVTWDDLCVLPFPRLDLLLVAYAEQGPRRGARELERLIETYPAQRMAALRAKVQLRARQTAGMPLGRLDAAVADLPESRTRFLRDVPELRRMISEITYLQQRLDE